MVCDELFEKFEDNKKENIDILINELIDLSTDPSCENKHIYVDYILIKIIKEFDTDIGNRIEKIVSQISDI